MVCSVAGFTVASMLCGLVDSLEALLALRVVQGAFGAPIFPMGQTIVLASFHRSQHPFIIMMWGVGGVMGPILGPTFGGLVAELMSWRWTFFLIFPLGILAGAMAFVALNDDEKGRARPLRLCRLRLHRHRHRGGPAPVRPRPAQRLVRLARDRRRMRRGGGVLRHVRHPHGDGARRRCSRRRPSATATSRSASPSR